MLVPHPSVSVLQLKEEVLLDPDRLKQIAQAFLVEVRLHHRLTHTAQPASQLVLQLLEQCWCVCSCARGCVRRAVL